ncbi:P-type conjugative transfer protein TrbL [Burkholderia ambifaria AMMD]|uniref:TrbL/VirB6 plasmid conjugal transfer protein n=1 Tax=Burkholderia ambifaria (strain ATCC BAA-244 / DSM 16087 / CCUG 44356 / LMG 19182 / AMMD) TaxID=339670 RepID=Q0BE57_BURCM|nr:P-type conjugative transfer protein TrbL [Burkholderia ambifaria]ABI87566.1 TrbL/VirB6 plasmid conjugal transfer protein [Burkholderia ambifaria AMMD]AJY21772.1 P-type conjugative transfer protein TrbL [Burkholderia ambifaria AMMD]MBR7929057.1 P-type conjugative transfer protein TrbL [Burkholderia ambifaria]PEH65233.1 P-type conjugative transfer protein TrbL [Burkholderia ambifaria]QQC05228.1 P-type conjugative transfer protein TrbL [Burkholderia ambifaria]
MNDVTIIDRFLDTFSRYIDSGFGLLQGEVAFLTATLIVIDMTIAGLYWAMSHATGQGEDVIAKLLRKVLYVGAFAYIIGNFNWLAGIVFRSFAGLGLTATGSAMTMENFLQPGRLAKTGIDAGAPILEQIGDMAGFPEVFVNIDPIVVMFLAWLTVILCFFVLAIQLFITLIEFKLTTLAGFVLVPFALWNKTSFLAEKVLGNVVSSGIKVLVLAVIVGIGSGLFAEFQVHPDEPSIDHALVVMLASLALLALGIFGPGIATGLVSGAPQLGAGAMAGAAVGAAGTAVAIGAAATGLGGAVVAGARMAPAAAKLAGAGARAATSAAGSARLAFQAGSAAAGGGARGAMAGSSNVAKTGAQSFGRSAASGASGAAQKMTGSFRAGWNGTEAGGGAASGAAGSGQAAAGEATDSAASSQKQEQPAWAKRMHRRQQITHAATTAAHTLRGGDGGGSGQGPSLRGSDD